MRTGIGQRLRQIRASASQQEIADKLAVSLRTYANYERGERAPDAETLLALVEEGWNANWLLTGHGPERATEDGAAVSAAGNDTAHAPSQVLSDEALTIALELADKALGGGYLPRPRYAKLVRLLYEGITQGLPFAQVLQFGQKASAAMANGDEVNDGEQGLGQPGRKAAG